MIEYLLFFIHGTLLLIFGICLSAAFAGIRGTKKNVICFAILCIVCGGLQIAALMLYGEMVVWKLYPIITHIPLILFLCIYYHKRLVTVIASVSTAYLCCQPAKWFGIVVFTFNGSEISEAVVQCCTLVIVGLLILKYLSPYLSEIFNKDGRSVCIFGSIPVVYYLFDYGTVIYTDLWSDNNRVAAEFMPFFLGAVFIMFCIIYHREYEQKADAQRAEQIVRVSARQHEKEMEALKRSEQEVKLLRHDMRLLLSSIALCIDNGDTEHAKEMISTYTSRIEGTKIKRFCKAELINYVLSDFEARCGAEDIEFKSTIEIGELGTDEMMFSSILSNALDNALNAQMNLAACEREVEVTMRSLNGKLLLSIENPTYMIPVFSDGMPVTNKEGHGYGTQSIRYMTERLGGKCQFTAQGKRFIVRIAI